DYAQTQIFGGSQIVDVTLSGPDPKLLLTRPKSFQAEASGGGPASVVPVDVQIPDALKKAHRAERHEQPASGPKMEEAKVVIAGGRGLQQPENFKLLPPEGETFRHSTNTIVLTATSQERRRRRMRTPFSSEERPYATAGA